MTIDAYLCKSCIACKGNVCTLYNKEIKPDRDFCSDHMNKGFTSCKACGNIIPRGGVIIAEAGRTASLCEKCYHTYFCTCNGCSHNRCEFDTNPAPIPKFVTQTIQQGNSTFQTQVVNPERIKRFCEECLCYDTKNKICMKQYNTICNDFDEIIEIFR